MAGSFNDYLELKLLDYVFGGTSFSSPTDCYFLLATAAISDSTTGTTVTQPSGGSYARVQVTNDKTLWSNASSGALSNAAAVSFPQATGSWGTVTHFAIADAGTNGNLICWADLATSKTIDSGDTATFAIGDIDITLT